MAQSFDMLRYKYDHPTKDQAQTVAKFLLYFTCIHVEMILWLGGHMYVKSHGRRLGHLRQLGTPKLLCYAFLPYIMTVRSSLVNGEIDTTALIFLLSKGPGWFVNGLDGLRLVLRMLTEVLFEEVYVAVLQDEESPPRISTCPVGVRKTSLYRQTWSCSGYCSIHHGREES